MGFLLKPGLLEKAANAADVQRLMKADLKNNLGKKGVKFVAAKNCVIGGRTVHLFLVTDAPAPLEAVIKAKHPKAYRAKGTCDLEKDKATGALKVTIKSSVGQMLPDAVAKLLPEAVGRDRSFVAQVAAPSGARPTLKPVPKVDRDGIPKWARDAFGKEPRTIEVMVSMTSDGKIGSVYFEGDGRIRTTHFAGPTGAAHADATTVRFNIAQPDARKEWQSGYKPDSEVIRLEERLEQARQAANENLHRELSKEYLSKLNAAYQAWVKAKLAQATLKSTPRWAKLVAGLDTAPKVSSRARPSDETQLVEIFKKIDGKVGSHFSRGSVGKFETDEQTLHVLREGISYIDRVGPDGKKLVTDPNARNIEFYNFVKARLPSDSQLMRAIRRPSQIKLKQK